MSADTKAFSIEEFLQQTEPLAEHAEVQLPSGQTFIFRRLVSYADLQALRAKSLEYTKACEKTVPPGLKGLHTDVAITGMAFVLAETVISPEWKIAEFLKMANSRGMLFERLLQLWDIAQNDYILERQKAEESREGEESAETKDTASG